MFSIGEKIKELRKDNNMTQSQLAQILGVSYQAVSKWENGSATPDISLIPDITKAFSISADVLFDLVNPEVRKEEIYEEYADIMDVSKNYIRARKLMERAIKEFPKEYKFYIMLGAMADYEVKNGEDDNRKKEDYQFAKDCYDKVITECDDEDTILLAKAGIFFLEGKDEEEVKDVDPAVLLKATVDFIGLTSPE